MRIPTMLMGSPWETDDWVTYFSYMLQIWYNTIKSPGYEQIKNDVNWRIQMTSKTFIIQCFVKKQD